MMVAAAAAAAFAAYLAAGLVLGVRPLRLRRRGHVRISSVRPVTVGVSIGAAVGASAFVARITTSVPIGLTVGLLAGAGVLWAAAAREARGRRRAVEAWPDALRLTSSGITAGLPPASALQDVATQGPAALRPLFVDYTRLLPVFGAERSLRAVQRQLADPVSDRVIEGLVVAVRQGGPGAAVLVERLADHAGEDLRLSDEIDTASLEQRINARVVVVVPWVVLVLLTARPGFYRDFYVSGAGVLVIIAAAALTVVGMALLVRFGASQVERRVFIGGPT